MSNHMDFFISDLHFGHENIIKFDIRPFNNVENMNNIMINNWNKVVTNTDTVYILGDMFCSINSANAIEILVQLKGYKVLIMGNHDKIFNKEFANHFIEISDYKEIQCKEKHVVLCHYPIPCFNNHFLNNWYHFYGHVHQILNQTNVRGKNRKAVVDEVAATVILESYLNYRRKNKPSI